MRMWMVDTRILCTKHLNGEHGELHKFKWTFEKKHKKDGYIKRNCIEPLAMQKRHDELAEEMTKRGGNHKSPFEAPDVSYLPKDQINYKIDVEANLKLLLDRCPDCAKRYSLIFS